MEVTLTPIPLQDLIAQGGDSLDNMLHSFTCGVNKSIEDFLYNNATRQEKESNARTTLIIDEGSGDAVGYFTLLIANFTFTDGASGKDKKKVAGSKEATSFNCILIAKIGRSDKYKGKVSGANILEAAIYNCSLVKDMTATKLVCVEYIDEPNLTKFYEDNGFKYLQKNKNELNISFLKI